MKENLFFLAIIMVMVPIAGELKLYPFHTSFRISFGTPLFFFFLLWTRKIPLILSGFMVGICVVAFRITLDSNVEANFHLVSSLRLHLPALFYYLAYSSLFYLMKINTLHNSPLLLGILSVLAELISSVVELYFRYLILGNIITLYFFGEVILIAVVRSFFVLGFFNVIKLHQAKLEMEHQQEQNKRMLLLISGLYAESIQLKKSLKNAEDITRDCYSLYSSLQNKSYSLKTDELAKNLLGIAGRVHEIKKDNQRIYAGLSKMISNEKSSDYMSAQETGDIIIQANQKYANYLGKDIKFILNSEDDIPSLHVYTILSLVNNLVSNAVESIKNTGIIKISISKINQMVEFRVCDNGVGIPRKKKELIFKPGYTTKYDASGNPSTGMGLPYVKEVVNKLGGTITLQDTPIENGTIFILKLPINNLVRR